jgi:molecular chaperone HscB
MDPFAILGIPRGFDVDLGAVERAHRELARQWHPDRHVRARAIDKRAALSKAVEVNEAWRIVRDPIRRAEALFSLGGVEIGEDHEPRAAPEFLMEMLEQREALAEARAARDLEQVHRLARVVERRLRETERELSRGFAAGEGEPLVRVLGELRFFRRFLDEVSAIEDELAA